MEVVKKVDHGTIDFNCKACLTVTRAKSGEYKQMLSNEHLDHAPKGGFIARLLSTTDFIRELIPAWCLEITCPVCGRFVDTYKRTGEKSTFIDVVFS